MMKTVSYNEKNYLNIVYHHNKNTYSYNVNRLDKAALIKGGTSLWKVFGLLLGRHDKVKKLLKRKSFLI